MDQELSVQDKLDFIHNFPQPVVFSGVRRSISAGAQDPGCHAVPGHSA